MTLAYSEKNNIISMGITLLVIHVIDWSLTDSLKFFAIWIHFQISNLLPDRNWGITVSLCPM